MSFDYKTNRIINGICEFCGVSADNCAHYAHGEPRPMDEATRLIEGKPPASVVAPPIPPLTEEELKPAPKPEASSDEESAPAPEVGADAPVISEGNTTPDANV